MSSIINYVVKYQNNFSSAYLFTKNIQQIIEMGVEVKGLFESNIFCFDFDYDEWPGTHFNDEK